jgi:hypothetical protein
MNSDSASCACSLHNARAHYPPARHPHRDICPRFFETGRRAPAHHRPEGLRGHVYDWASRGRPRTTR